MSGQDSQMDINQTANNPGPAEPRTINIPQKVLISLNKYTVNTWLIPIIIIIIIKQQ